MAKIYFQFPSWKGRVYEVTGETYESFRKGNGLVQLPEDKLMLKVELEPGYFPTASEEAPASEKVTVFKKARFVFDTTDAVRRFEGNWQLLVELLNAAGAAVKTLLSRSTYPYTLHAHSSLSEQGRMSS